MSGRGSAFFLSIGSPPNPEQAQINFKVDFKIVTFKKLRRRKKKKNLSSFYSVLNSIGFHAQLCELEFFLLLSIFEILT